MTKFTNVIVRKPGKSLCNGITSAPELGQPIYERAVEEHDDYIAALKQCGVEVTELPALEEYPDSCFVEDPAVITRCGAIITNPGADSRNGEKDEIEPTIRQFFDDEHVKHIVCLLYTSRDRSPPAASSRRRWSAPSAADNRETRERGRRLSCSLPS